MEQLRSQRKTRSMTERDKPETSKKARLSAVRVSLNRCDNLLKKMSTTSNSSVLAAANGDSDGDSNDVSNAPATVNDDATLEAANGDSNRDSNDVSNAPATVNADPTLNDTDGAHASVAPKKRKAYEPLMHDNHIWHRNKSLNNDETIYYDCAAK